MTDWGQIAQSGTTVLVAALGFFGIRHTQKKADERADARERATDARAERRAAADSSSRTVEWVRERRERALIDHWARADSVNDEPTA